MTIKNIFWTASAAFVAAGIVQTVQILVTNLM